MDNISGLIKKVKIPEKILPTYKVQMGDGLNLKTVKKNLEELMNEKVKIYGFIGMEVYDLSKENKIEIVQIKNYLDKMDALNGEINKLEKQKEELEKKSVGKNVCSCGCKLKPQDRFCPNCGEVVSRDTILCTCGAELSKDVKFCSVCGKRTEDILQEQAVAKEPPKMRECICGAKVPEGQFMCMECGRKIED